MINQIPLYLEPPQPLPTPEPMPNRPFPSPMPQIRHAPQKPNYIV